MALEDQIAQIVDPDTFTRLCNAVFSQCYGEAFQCIDGTRGDEGVDGYVKSEARVLAFYCPKKPERCTDRSYEKKIRSDLAKAMLIRDVPGFPVRRWTFVTPRKLAASVVRTLLQVAAEGNIEANHFDSTFLALELAKTPTLLALFPELQLPGLDEKLDEVLRRIGASPGEKVKPGRSPARIVSAAPGEETEDYRRVIAVRRQGSPTAEARTELRAIYYKTLDDFAKINALLGLVEWADPKRCEHDEIATLCDEGIRIAQKMGVREVEALLEARNGFVLTQKFVQLDTQHRSEVRAANSLGVPLYSAEQWQEIQNDLRRLQTSSQQHFEQALTLASEDGDIALAGKIALFIGMAAGIRAIHVNAFAPIAGAALFRTCKKALMLSKDISRSLGNDVGVGYALHNLANYIRFFGEEAEALILAKEADEIARRLGDLNLGRTSAALVERLKGDSGELPD